MALTSAPPVAGPCAPWATVADITKMNFLAADDIDGDTLDVHLQNATEVLYNKSGRQYPGECQILDLRPVCRSEIRAWDHDRWGAYGYDAGFYAELVAGQWFNGPLGGDSPCVMYECGQAVAKIDLGAYPVTEVTEVLIDGTAVPDASMRLDNWQYLYRIDGERWPTVNHIDRARDAEGVFSIKFKYGQPPPTGGVLACSELASELAKHTLPGAKSHLPLRTTSVSRSGVSYSLADVMDIIDKGSTGFYFVDLFIKSVNPHGLEAPPRVLSPDLVQQRQVR